MLFFCIGLAIAVVGSLMVYLKNWKWGSRTITIVTGIILMLSGACILVFSQPSKEMPDGSPGLVILGFIGAAVALIVILITRKKTIEKNKEIAVRRSEIIGATTLDRFLVECVLSDACIFHLEKNKQRAQLLADKYNLDYSNGIEQLFRQALEAHKAVSQRLAADKLQAKRCEERKLYEELNRYSNFVGKDKRIAMLSDRAAELRNKAENQKKSAKAIISSGQQKERDWAIWGGIADGIAGFGAGVATAIDIQMENNQIREENKQRMKAALPAYLSITDSASNNIRNANCIMEEIESFKLKLISNISKESLMENITFSNTDIMISEIGSALICTVASLKPDFVIFDDVPAIVDGTILAEIYDGERLCGTAQLVLPVYGLGQNITLNGICLECCNPNTKYTVKFVAKNLWAMEK